MPDQPASPGVIIAPHHADDPWRPLCPWPAGTHVQWGGRGVVIQREGESYRTAFFEAFPADGSAGFIRGEGDNVEAAEAAAFAEWSKNHQCRVSGGHRWSRTRRLRDGKVTTYTNGGCFCLRCGAFQTVMRPIAELGSSRKPLSVTELDSMASGFCRPSPWSAGRSDQAKWRRRLALRARWAGIDLPPFDGPRDPKRHPFEPDDYERGCRRAVAAFVRQNPDRIARGHGGDLFSSLSAASIRRLAEDPDAN